MLSRDGPGTTGGPGAPGTDGADGAPGVPDGVLDDASFNTTTYEATLERTIGADVALDLSPIDTTHRGAGKRYATDSAHQQAVRCATLQLELPQRTSPRPTFSLVTPPSRIPRTSTRRTAIPTMVMGIAVPMSEGELTGVAELDSATGTSIRLALDDPFPVRSQR